MRAILFSGGIFHDFDQMSAVVAGILASAGFAVEIVIEPSDLVEALREPADLVFVLGLRWRMLGHEKYEPYRERWAYQTGDDLKTALTTHAAKGGGIMALHTGCISFDDWPGWQELTGGGWIWGESFHAPGIEPVSVHLQPHTVTQGISDFVVQDEHYRKLRLSPEAEVIAIGKTESGEAHPVAWLRHGSSRAATITTGHDLASLTHPAQATLIRQAALWVAAPTLGEPA